MPAYIFIILAIRIFSDMLKRQSPLTTICLTCFFHNLIGTIVQSLFHMLQQLLHHHQHMHWLERQMWHNCFCTSALTLTTLRAVCLENLYPKYPNNAPKKPNSAAITAITRFHDANVIFLTVYGSGLQFSAISSM